MDNNNSIIRGYIGTYTLGESKGIYTFTLDLSSGTIQDIALGAELQNPTYTVIDKENKYLYSVIKSPEEKDLESNGVAAFSIDDSTGRLKLINYETLTGKSPCHVNLDKNKRYLFSANYHEGTVAIFPITDEGSIAIPTEVVKHTGSGPNKERQEAPHVHFTALSPDEKFLLAVDLGTDRIEAYDFNFQSGKLQHNPSLSTILPGGSGPRHLAFHPNGRYFYVITELSSEVVLLDYNREEYSIKALQTISTLPDNFTRENTGAAIRITPDGRFLYASNRGANSLAAFAINQESGELSLIDFYDTLGDGPRDFNIDPTGKFIIAANEKSSSIVVYSIDQEKGSLKVISDPIEVPNPVSIAFLNPITEE